MEDWSFSYSVSNKEDQDNYHIAFLLFFIAGITFGNFFNHYGVYIKW